MSLKRKRGDDCSTAASEDHCDVVSSTAEVYQRHAYEFVDERDARAKVIERAKERNAYIDRREDTDELVELQTTFLDMKAVKEALDDTEKISPLLHVEGEGPAHFAKQCSLEVCMEIPMTLEQFIVQCSGGNGNGKRSVFDVEIARFFDEAPFDTAIYDCTRCVVQHCVFSGKNPFNAKICVGSSLHESILGLPHRLILTSEQYEERLASLHDDDIDNQFPHTADDDDDDDDDSDSHESAAGYSEDEDDVANGMDPADLVNIDNLDATSIFTRLPDKHETFAVLQPSLDNNDGSGGSGDDTADMMDSWEKTTFRKPKSYTESEFLNVFGGCTIDTLLNGTVWDKGACFIPERLAMSMLLKVNLPQIQGARQYARFDDIYERGKVIKCSRVCVNTMARRATEHILDPIPYEDISEASMFLYTSDTLESAEKRIRKHFKSLETFDTVRQSDAASREDEYVRREMTEQRSLYMTLKLELTVWEHGVQEKAICLFDSGETLYFSDRFYVKTKKGDVLVDQREVNSEVRARAEDDYIRSWEESDRTGALPAPDAAASNGNPAMTTVSKNKKKRRRRH